MLVAEGLGVRGTRRSSGGESTDDADAEALTGLSDMRMRCSCAACSLSIVPHAVLHWVFLEDVDFVSSFLLCLPWANHPKKVTPNVDRSVAQRHDGREAGASCDNTCCWRCRVGMHHSADRA